MYACSINYRVRVEFGNIKSYGDELSILYYERNVVNSVTTYEVIYLNNNGTIQLANNWSMGGRTCHIGLKTNHLQILKESGFIVVLYKKKKVQSPILEHNLLQRRSKFTTLIGLFIQCCRVKVMVPSSKMTRKRQQHQ